MTLFSERYRYKSVRDSLQFESMDEELKNVLWNFLCKLDLDYGHNIGSYPENLEFFYKDLWSNFWKMPLDDLYTGLTSPYAELRKFFFNCEWYEIYDLLEFFLNHIPHYFYCNQEGFIKSANEVLEAEKSGYRFIGFKITPLHSEKEINAIEKAIENSPDPVQTHLEEALKLLSDKKSPNYRNSIKESISAVESICKLISNDSKSTLGKCLTKIENQIKMHSSLKEAFKKLYGYTSDSDGIRHALLDESKLDLEDAMFMLVSCSTFINYLLTKAEKADIIIYKKQ